MVENPPLSALLARCRLLREDTPQTFDRVGNIYRIEHPQESFESYYILQTLEGYCEGEFADNPMAVDGFELTLARCPEYLHACRGIIAEKVIESDGEKEKFFRAFRLHLLRDFNTSSDLPTLPLL